MGRRLSDGAPSHSDEAEVATLGAILIDAEAFCYEVAWYFLLTIALSLPFLLLGALISLQIVPGVPISGLAFSCPGAAAAAILCYREGGRRGLRDFLRRSFDFSRRWIVKRARSQESNFVQTFAFEIPLGRLPLAAKCPGLRGYSIAGHKVGMNEL